jgi:PKHD-type hydroxylase
MTYAFPPSPAMVVHSHAWWSGDPLSPETLKRIIDLCETLPKEKGSVGGGEGYNALTNTRDCSVAWVPFPGDTPDTKWLFDLLAPLAMKVNEDYFRFNLWGFMEKLQYTVYEGGGQHYDWHVDSISGNRPARKLSFSLLLSSPMTYEGGDLMIAGQSPQVLQKHMGMIHFFPSYTSHRVTPVTAGVRRSLVGWINGEDFR